MVRRRGLSFLVILGLILGGGVFARDGTTPSLNDQEKWAVPVKTEKGLNKSQKREKAGKGKGMAQNTVQSGKASREEKRECQVFCVRRFCDRCSFSGVSALTPENDRQTGWQIAPLRLSIQSPAASACQRF